MSMDRMIMMDHYPTNSILSVHNGSFMHGSDNNNLLPYLSHDDILSLDNIVDEGDTGHAQYPSNYICPNVNVNMDELYLDAAHELYGCMISTNFDNMNAINRITNNNCNNIKNNNNCTNNPCTAASEHYKLGGGHMRLGWIGSSLYNTMVKNGSDYTCNAAKDQLGVADQLRLPLLEQEPEAKVMNIGMGGESSACDMSSSGFVRGRPAVRLMNDGGGSAGRREGRAASSGSSSSMGKRRRRRRWCWDGQVCGRAAAKKLKFDGGHGLVAGRDAAILSKVAELPAALPRLKKRPSAATDQYTFCKSNDPITAHVSPAPSSSSSSSSSRSTKHETPAASDDNDDDHHQQQQQQHRRRHRHHHDRNDPIISNADHAPSKPAVPPLPECSNASASASCRSTTHIAVERNRRKQMNEHLAILRSLMPKSYVQRADQASIIGGVVDFINELKELVESLESRKRRRSVMYGAIISSPKSVMCPQESAETSPSGTGNNNQKYRKYHNIDIALGSPTTVTTLGPYTPNNTSLSVPRHHELLLATSSSPLVEVDVRLEGGTHVILRTRTPSIPSTCQTTLMSSRVANSCRRKLLGHLVVGLERLDFQILHIHIMTNDNVPQLTADHQVLYTFTLNIGIDCRVSVEELADAVQQIFKETHSC